ncbi:hypothetical protein ACWDF1_37450 [Streptomyces coelicoflavus]|uniref:hypothetical protein n=1 Tax=Streptomyces TaxID=1883 RepID=UPI00117EE9D5|nr:MULTISPECIES: hypothetical protein [Streptomyces]
MKKPPTTRVKAALSTGALLLAGVGLNLATASPAAAGGCTHVLGQELCGRVINSDASDKWLVVADNWNCGGSGTACGNKVRLYPGERSVDGSDGMTDADGVYVPNGCSGRMGTGGSWGPGWHKISNNLGYYKVRIYC